jgi:hypothetical protein
MLVASGPSSFGCAAERAKPPEIVLPGVGSTEAKDQASPDAEQNAPAPRAGWTEAAPKPDHPASDEEAESSYLTLVCVPGCDEVIDNGKSLGPTPLVRLAVPPGKRVIEARSGALPTKYIHVVMTSGELTAVRVFMGPSSGSPATLMTTGPAAPGNIAVSSGSSASPNASIRASLEPKAWAGKASLEELRMLRAICSFDADKACRDRATAMIKAQKQSP